MDAPGRALWLSLNLRRGPFVGLSDGGEGGALSPYSAQRQTLLQAVPRVGSVARAASERRSHRPARVLESHGFNSYKNGRNWEIWRNSPFGWGGFADFRQICQFIAMGAQNYAQWVNDLKTWAGGWPAQAADYFADVWGLNRDFAFRVAVLFLAQHVLGLNPRITSGFRDPEKQRLMRVRWDAGDRAGLRARPANPDTSKHCRTTISGAPNSHAIDIVSSDEQLSAEIARALGLAAGQFFTTPDPGHYQSAS